MSFPQWFHISIDSFKFYLFMLWRGWMTAFFNILASITDCWNFQLILFYSNSKHYFIYLFTFWFFVRYYSHPINIWICNCAIYANERRMSKVYVNSFSIRACTYQKKQLKFNWIDKHWNGIYSLWLRIL